MGFTVDATAPDSRARSATLVTPHGAIETPVFMPVGTRGTVRTQTLAQLEQLGAPILLANTYHLWVRPGRAVFEQLGGLHRFMGWSRALLTDSGGFQIFSLPGTRVAEDGAELDGQWLTPESSIAMQTAIGADIMMVLDHCVAAKSSHAEARDAMDRTHRWARRSLAARTTVQQLFGIVQGACVPELRRESAAVVTALPFDGYAIGGLAVGETRAERQDMTELVTDLLPHDRPRYLMGVGTPLDLLEGVHRGVDLFDCILPTALAQQGVAFTSRGRIELDRGVHRLSEVALDPRCDCAACTRHSRAYLHHLVKCKEPLAWQLLATHNLAFYLRLMSDIRTAIRAGTFARFVVEQRPILGAADLDHPPGKHPRKKRGKPTARGAFALHVDPARERASIRHVASGEIMHSVNDPDVEAERIYIDQSRRIAHALARATPLVVWDVGLGAAHNAMALVRRLAGRDVPCTLVSFERDLDALRLAVMHTGAFPHLRHEAPHRLLHAGHYARDGLTWVLREGDFLDHLDAAPRPDVIFYDPFSTKVDGPLWSFATLSRLYAVLAREPRPCELFTYTTSTAVRTALLAAGFHVACGVASGPKAETTIALVHPEPGEHAWLGADWLDRRARSTARWPADGDPAQIERALAAHAQFQVPRG
ncbi:MAG TPA: tRNA guanosine(34) transglycosylase Tgt [Kofleriaceae bacterium]|nr:tRNA guanosine(34) transglycosylase Tgt [Kofleriaceae bacterium]